MLDLLIMWSMCGMFSAMFSKGKSNGNNKK